MKHTMRHAIAMIELIFAIVILGIVMMSAPMMISTATNSGYVALQQEAIAVAASDVGMVLTNQWDEADTNASRFGPVLVTTNGNTALAEASVSGILTGRRAGTPTSSTRSFYTASGQNSLSASATLGDEGGDRDDIDDYNGVTTKMTEVASTSANIGDVVDVKMSIATTVQYINDGGPYNGAASMQYDFNLSGGAVAPTTSIKQVNVVLTSNSGISELAKTITLNAFSCNIGTYQLNQRFVQ